MRRTNIAVLLSGHGFGHLTRTANVLESLGDRRPVSLRVITSAPRRLWPSRLRRHTTEWIEQRCDAGVVQVDDLSVDVEATRLAVEAWDAGRDATLDRIVGRIRRDGRAVDLIVGDVPPIAFDLADALRVPSVAVANFSWDWIYDELGLSQAAESARRAYRKAELLLELSPAAPMPAFPQRRTIGTVGRDARSRRHSARAALGLAPSELVALLSFRDATLSSLALPPPRRGWRFVAPVPFALPRTDLLVPPVDLDFLDLLAASDVVVAKTGYGILADCAATGRPLVWVARQGFPEDRVLEKWLATQQWARQVERSALATGAWADALTGVVSAPAPDPLGARGAHAASAAIDELLR